jgi:histidine triad (HIT) family protein
MSHLLHDPSCLFCKIIAREIPSVKIYEDDETYAFMDLFPQTKGHCLVIPKNHSANMFEASIQDINASMAVVKKLAPAVKLALNADGIVITQFNGAAAGQTVFHIHYHILPAYEGVPMKRHAGDQADVADLQATAAKIIDAL